MNRQVEIAILIEGGKEEIDSEYIQKGDIVKVGRYCTLKLAYLH
jgi:hypothetical protein